MSRANSYICDLTPYQPGLPIELVARQYGIAARDIIKLASNENPLGPSPKALAALQKAESGMHRYPEQYALVQALAAHHSVDVSTIIIGNGSNDVLDLIARTYLKPGDEAVSSQYAFAVYQIATQSVGATNVVIPAQKFGHDPAAMQAAITPATKVVWIANPNNPTGTFWPSKTLKGFIEHVPSEVVIVLDEAYYEYLEPADRPDSLAWLHEHPNLLVVRTFSKVYGLAGLRIGYGIGAPDAIEVMNRVRQPFNANSLAVSAAAAALGDTDFVAKSFTLNHTEKSALRAGLRDLGLEVLPAYGNFVTFKVAEAKAVNEALLHRGVIVRPLDSYGMADWLRVTVGLPAENQRFMESLRAVIT